MTYTMAIARVGQDAHTTSELAFEKLLFMKPCPTRSRPTWSCQKRLGGENTAFINKFFDSDIFSRIRSSMNAYDAYYRYERTPAHVIQIASSFDIEDKTNYTRIWSKLRCPANSGETGPYHDRTKSEHKF